MDFSVARVVKLLRTMEQHVDAAMAAGGEITAALVRTRLERGLSAVVGQPAFLAFSQAGMSLAEARGHAVRGHRTLDQLAGQLGIDVSMFGEERKDDGDVVSLPMGG